jgi:hypothetical protein
VTFMEKQSVVIAWLGKYRLWDYRSTGVKIASSLTWCASRVVYNATKCTLSMLSRYISQFISPFISHCWVDVEQKLFSQGLPKIPWSSNSTTAC